MFFTNFLRRYEVVLAMLCIWKISATPIEAGISQSVMAAIQLFAFHELTFCLVAILTLMDWAADTSSPIVAIANGVGASIDRFRESCQNKKPSA